MGEVGLVDTTRLVVAEQCAEADPHQKHRHRVAHRQGVSDGGRGGRQTRTRMRIGGVPLTTALEVRRHEPAPGAAYYWHGGDSHHLRP